MVILQGVASFYSTDTALEVDDIDMDRYASDEEPDNLSHLSILPPAILWRQASHYCSYMTARLQEEEHMLQIFLLGVLKGLIVTLLEIYCYCKIVGHMLRRRNSGNVDIPTYTFAREMHIIKTTMSLISQTLWCFLIKQPKEKVRIVTLSPKTKCSCLSTGECFYILVAKLHLGMNIKITFIFYHKSDKTRKKK